MANRTNSILFVARYSTIDRWSGYGKKFSPSFLLPNDYLLLFDFLDGKPPNRDTIKALQNGGMHYKVIEMEGMSQKEKEEVILNKINERSNESKIVALIDMDDFNSIFGDINCFSLETRKFITNEETKIVFSADVMRKKRKLKVKEALEKAGSYDLNPEDDEIRAEEEHQKELKNQLFQENNSSCFTTPDRPKEKHTTENNSFSDNHRKRPEKDGSQSRAESTKTADKGNNSQQKNNRLNRPTTSADDTFGDLVGDMTASFRSSSPAARDGKNGSPRVRVPERDSNKTTNNPRPNSPSGRGYASRNNRLDPRKNSKPDQNLKESGQQEQYSNRKEAERRIFGEGVISSDDSMRYSEYENARAKLFYLRMQEFISSLERAFPELKKKEMEYKHYYKLLITLVSSDTLEDFKQNWAITEPSKTFSLDEEPFFNFKKEGMYILEISNALFKDQWVL